VRNQAWQSLSVNCSDRAIRNPHDSPSHVRIIHPLNYRPFYDASALHQPQANLLPPSGNRQQVPSQECQCQKCLSGLTKAIYDRALLFRYLVTAIGSRVR